MRKLFVYFLWTLLAVTVLATGVAYYAIDQGWIGYMPPIEDLQNPINRFATQIYSADGKIIGTWNYNRENRVMVDYTKLSPSLVQALVATEDVRFYDHSGIDFYALGRAVVKRGLLGQKSAGGGSITIIAVTTLSGGDITHAVPDNTGYITEGQLYLRRDSDVGKVIIDPFRSLSRLKQLVAGKKTRKDHSQVMNAAIRLYADAANAKTKLENGFDLTDYDNRCLDFAKDYSSKLLAIDVNLNTEEMLDVTWSLFRKYFKLEEVNIKKEFTDIYWQ